MELSLYGHPESGYYWEDHCDKAIRKEGFDPIEEWPSCYWHEELKIMLIVYVDDFAMSGPKENLAKAWALIRKDKNGKGHCYGRTWPTGNVFRVQSQTI